MANRGMLMDDGWFGLERALVGSSGLNVTKTIGIFWDTGALFTRLAMIRIHMLLERSTDVMHSRCNNGIWKAHWCSCKLGWCRRPEYSLWGRRVIIAGALVFVDLSFLSLLVGLTQSGWRNVRIFTNGSYFASAKKRKDKTDLCHLCLRAETDHAGRKPPGRDWGYPPWSYRRGFLWDWPWVLLEIAGPALESKLACRFPFAGSFLLQSPGGFWRVGTAILHGGRALKLAVGRVLVWILIDIEWHWPQSPLCDTESVLASNSSWCAWFEMPRGWSWDRRRVAKDFRTYRARSEWDASQSDVTHSSGQGQ